MRARVTRYFRLLYYYHYFCFVSNGRFSQAILDLSVRQSVIYQSGNTGFLRAAIWVFSGLQSGFSQSGNPFLFVFGLVCVCVCGVCVL